MQVQDEPSTDAGSAPAVAQFRIRSVAVPFPAIFMAVSIEQRVLPISKSTSVTYTTQTESKHSDAISVQEHFTLIRV